MGPLPALTEYGKKLMDRYGQTGDPEDLSKAERIARLAVESCPAADASRGAFLSNLAVILRLQYRHNGDAAALTEAIDLLAQACEIATATDPDRGALMANHAMVLRLRYECTGNTADLQAAINRAREGVRATPVDHPERVPILSTLAGLLRTLAEHTGDHAAADEGLNLALHTLGQDPGHRPTLATAAAFYRLRSERTQDRDDLDRCVNFAHAAIKGLPESSPDRGRLESALFARHERYGDRRDIDEAIDAARRALTATSAGEVERAGFAANLAGGLRARFSSMGTDNDLDEATEAGRLAVDLAPPAGRVRVAALFNLASTYQARFEHRGSLEDLTEAIRLRRAALAATPDEGQLPALQAGLATALRSRFERTGDLADLDARITAGLDAVRTASQESPALGRYLANLSAAYRTRFERTGAHADAEQSVKAGRQALAVTAADDPARPRRLSTLALALLRSYGHSGERAAIDEAVSLGREAVAGTPRGHRLRPRLLANVANALRARYERTGDLADLSEAIAVAREAVNTTPAAEALRPRRLANLAAALLRRFESSHQSADIDQAVDAGRQAAEQTPADHPHRAMYLADLALACFRRFEAFEVPSDLDAAITGGWAATRTTPVGHPHKSGYLSNLVAPLLARFRQTRDDADLHEAVTVARAAVANAAGAYDYGGFQFNLGTALQIRYEQASSEEDREAAVAAFAACAASAVTAPLIRATAAVAQGRLAAAVQGWADADDAYGAAISLLPLVTDRRTGWDSRQSQLARLGGLASDAAAVALQLGEPERAVAILEEARGVLIGQALDTRSDTSVLRGAHPDLAAELDRLRAVLNADTLPSSEADTDIASMADPAAWRRQAVTDLDALLARIRATPGHAGFLKRPDIQELLQAATGGPMAIINISQYRCDALLVQTDGIRLVPLENLHHDDVAGKAAEFLATTTKPGWSTNTIIAQVLGWLWDTIAEPVLDALYPADGTPAAELPRLWWLPTGLLSLLPLHAAGRVGDRAVFDRIVSSYTPTIRALGYAQSGLTQPAATGNAKRLAVGVTAVGNQPALLRAVPEAQLVSDIMNAGSTPVTDADATHSAIVARLATAAWAHFACHAVTDLADPSSSALLLADGPLPVREIVASHPLRRWLAYLSACTTASSPGQLVDEVIHISSAFQLAGFPHVIGTLWRVSDAMSFDIASYVYLELASGTQPAHALHKAMSRARKRYPANPALWAAYVQIGS